MTEAGRIVGKSKGPKKPGGVTLRSAPGAPVIAPRSTISIPSSLTWQRRQFGRVSGALLERALALALSFWAFMNST
jgi:hypothetical protein